MSFDDLLGNAIVSPLLGGDLSCGLASRALCNDLPDGYYEAKRAIQTDESLWRSAGKRKHSLFNVRAIDSRTMVRCNRNDRRAAILTARGTERMLANTRVICSTYLNAWRYMPEGGSLSVRE
jgi:hypothetical protein